VVLGWKKQKTEPYLKFPYRRITNCLIFFILLLFYLEKGFCLRGDLCTFDHGSDPVIVDDMAFRGNLNLFLHSIISQ